MGPGGWRWWFRTKCKHIASTEKFMGKHGNGIRVKLCERWRWHTGECR